MASKSHSKSWEARLMPENPSPDCQLALKVSKTFVVILMILLLPSIISNFLQKEPLLARELQIFSLPDPTPRNFHFIFFRGDEYPVDFLTSWEALNTWNINFYTDNSTVLRSQPNLERHQAYFFVKKHRPHFLQIYKQSTWVERGDYMRYLALAIKGGVYADSDVTLTRPFGLWGHKYGHTHLPIEKFDFIFSLEYPRQREWRGVKYPFQVCQWVIACGEDSFMMMKVVEHIEDTMTKMPNAENQVDVMVRTGPAAFTKAILEVLYKYGVPPGRNLETGVPNCLKDYKVCSLNNGCRAKIKVPGETHTREGLFLPAKSVREASELSFHHYTGNWKGRNKTIHKSNKGLN